MIQKKRSIFLNWGSLGGNLFIGGGVDEKEELLTAATREVKEETGYSNLKYVGKTGTIFHSYFAHSKNIARRIEASGFLFELTDDQQGNTRLETDEKNKFTIEWLSENDCFKKIKDELHSLIFIKAVSGSELYVEEGVLVNSENYNGIFSEDAKGKNN